MSKAVNIKGKHSNYHWLVSSAISDNLSALIVSEFRGAQAWVAAIDSGPLQLTNGELAAGWRQAGRVGISPRLQPGIVIPQEGFDEWYIVDQPLVHTRPLEIFVNHGAFTLESERADDYLMEMQLHFWHQIEEIGPVAYVASGDRTIAVSRREGFISTLESMLSQ